MARWAWLAGGLAAGAFALAVTGVVVLGFRRATVPQGYLSRFRVVNRSGETAFVTMLGKTADGRIAVLPQFHSKEAPGRLMRPRAVPLPGGAAQSVLYDWDEIQFQWIAVRGAKGPWRIVRTGLTLDARNPNGAPSFLPADRKEYAIPPLDSLPLAPQAVAAAAE